MSNFATKCSKWYESGVYTLEMLENLVAKGKLTDEEYAEIAGAEEATEEAEEAVEEAEGAE